MTENKYAFVPVELLTEAPDGFVRHFHNYFWAVHPEKGVAFFTGTGMRREINPVCNSDGRIAKLSLKWIPEIEVRQIEHVYVRSDFDGRLTLPKIPEKAVALERTS